MFEVGLGIGGNEAPVRIDEGVVREIGRMDGGAGSELLFDVGKHAALRLANFLGSEMLFQ